MPTIVFSDGYIYIIFIPPKKHLDLMLGATDTSMERKLYDVPTRIQKIKYLVSLLLNITSINYPDLKPVS